MYIYVVCVSLSSAFILFIGIILFQRLGKIWSFFSLPFLFCFHLEASLFSLLLAFLCDVWMIPFRKWHNKRVSHKLIWHYFFSPIMLPCLLSYGIGGERWEEMRMLWRRRGGRRSSAAHKSEHKCEFPTIFGLLVSKRVDWVSQTFHIHLKL